MPKLGDLLNQDSVIYHAQAMNRLDAIKLLAKQANIAFGIDTNLAFEGTMTREALGGTGVGEGVAVPHARIKGIKQTYGVFALLKEAVDFESPDNKPADLVFMLLSPEESGANHLKALAKITRMLRQPAIRASLRAARSQSALLALLINAETPQVA